MKRKVLLFFVAFTLLTCFFALGVFATEIKLETSVLDDIHTSIEDGILQTRRLLSNLQRI